MEFIRTICFKKYAETMSLAANIYLPAQCVCSNFFFRTKGITPALEKKLNFQVAKPAGPSERSERGSCGLSEFN